MTAVKKKKGPTLSGRPTELNKARPAKAGRDTASADDCLKLDRGALSAGRDEGTVNLHAA